MGLLDEAAARKHARLIESMLIESNARVCSVSQTVESIDVCVELGLVLPQSLLGNTDDAGKNSSTLAKLTDREDFKRLVTRDAVGHTRPAYLPLMVWSWARAISISTDQLWSRNALASLRSWCGRLEAIVEQFTFPDCTLPAHLGAEAGEAACAAMALHVAGRALNEHFERAETFMVEVAARQHPSGAFFSTVRSDNPETRWFHELVLLHALSTFAIDTGDAALLLAADRAAQFHQDETQPDHATHQPWGITAFLWNSDTLPLADQMLHAARVKSTGGIDAVSLMLLADCLYCLCSHLGVPLVDREQ